jgi:tetratricopeptide (TPR) repeat protein
MDAMATALWDLYENQKVKGLSAAMRQTLAKLEKTGQADHRWFNAMGELAMQEKAYPVAARFFKLARDEKPLPAYHLNLGNALFYSGDFSGAKQILEAYRARFPEDMHGLIDLANCHLKLGELPQAKALCHEGLSRKSGHASFLNCLGEIAHLEGDAAKAHQLFGRAYAEAPEYVDALFNRANMAYHMGRMDDALADFSLCVRKDENFEAAWFNMAIIRLERGETSEARRDVERLLRLNPGHLEALYLLGRVRLAAKEFRAAREVFQEILKRDSDHISSLLALARLHLQEAEPTQAQTLLKQVLAKPALREEEATACLSLLMEAGETGLCVQHLQRKPDGALKPEARKLLILGAWKLGRTEDAIAHLESLLLVEGETASNLALLGRMLLQSGAPELAESRLRKALGLDPASRAAAFELAGLLTERGDADQAVPVLENLLREIPDDPDCLYNLACCHARNHNFDDSLHYLKRAVEHGFRDQDKIHADRDLQAIRQFKEYSQLAGQAGLIG